MSTLLWRRATVQSANLCRRQKKKDSRAWTTVQPMESAKPWFILMRCLVRSQMLNEWHKGLSSIYKSNSTGRTSLLKPPNFHWHSQWVKSDSALFIILVPEWGGVPTLSHDTQYQNCPKTNQKPDGSMRRYIRKSSPIALYEIEINRD